ncbi:MAG TPA: flagellar assembly protein FliX [Rhodospirillaceae bacterium]|nr:flagellar assembly protein FliX [Rhodospirillaceae bacterium]
MISRIEGPSPLRTATHVKRTKKSKKSDGAGFSKHLDGTQDASGLQGAGALGAVSGVLDIQEVDDALDRASRGKLRAEDMLEKLDSLRLELLSGQLSQGTVQHLSNMVKEHRTEVDDPKLSKILDEIDLRAQVELAKFTRA